ncbi:MAG: DUF192 domain-containing protein [Capsulimonas sp.]|uniref:DUF192 domain-containing protein n=1 Tax=Capsulimonas sp. TaxID=2494211 RepID=UPI00326565CD
MADYVQYMLALASNGAPLARVERVDSWWAQGIGVLGRRALPVGEGMWFPGVASIHTCFVAFPLDILFLSSDLSVLAVLPGVPPWRPLVRCPGAAHTIELGAGTLAVPLVHIGDAVLLEPQ